MHDPTSPDSHASTPAQKAMKQFSKTDAERAEPGDAPVGPNDGPQVEAPAPVQEDDMRNDTTSRTP